MPPWRNQYLLFAIALSMSLHMMILYVPMFNVNQLQLNRSKRTGGKQIDMFVSVFILDYISNMSFIIGRMDRCI